MVALAKPRQGAAGPAAGPRRAQREDQLVAAALECIGALGLRDTTVQDIAARAGMAQGSINQYFETKEQLFTAVLRSLADEFAAGWRYGLERCGPDPARRLRAFVDCYFAASVCQRRKIAVWFAFWGEVKARPQYRAVCAAHDAAHDRMLEALCGALGDGGDEAAAAARAAAKIIASVCHGLWLELLTGSDGLGRTELASLAHGALRALYPRHAECFA